MKLWLSNLLLEYSDQKFHIFHQWVGPLMVSFLCVRQDQDALHKLSQLISKRWAQFGVQDCFENRSWGLLRGKTSETQEQMQRHGLLSEGPGIRDEPAPVQACMWIKYEGVGPPGVFVIRQGSYLVLGTTGIFRGKVSLEKIRNNLLLSNYFCPVDCCPGVNLCSNFYFEFHVWLRPVGFW